MRRAPGVLLASAALAAAVQGCGGYQWAHITGPATSVRPGDAVPLPLQTPARARGRTTLHAASGCGDAELELLKAALQMTSAAGRHRLVADGEHHFGRLAAHDGEARPVVVAGTFIVQVGRRLPHGPERWVIDSRWALRQLEGGAGLAYEGDFAQVVATLELLERADVHHARR